jgi:hypothetical protein
MLSFEDRYTEAKGGIDHEDVSDASSGTETTVHDEDLGQDSEPSDYDDRHLNEIASNDSIWDTVVDDLGRPGTDPEGKCALG